MKTIIPIYRETPAGTRKIGYAINEVRNGWQVRAIAQINHVPQDGWTWKACAILAREIAKPYSHFLDRYSVKCVIDLRSPRRKPVALMPGTSGRRRLVA